MEKFSNSNRPTFSQDLTNALKSWALFYKETYVWWFKKVNWDSFLFETFKILIGLLPFGLIGLGFFLLSIHVRHTLAFCCFYFAQLIIWAIHSNLKPKEKNIRFNED